MLPSDIEVNESWVVLKGFVMRMRNSARLKTGYRRSPARIEYLRVENYRALRAIELKGITPQIKDAPFDRPVLARFASDGTLKLLAYLIVLFDPQPPQFIGIEEPENFLHPRLLPELGEEGRAATARSQLLVTTHSPFFLNAMKPHEVRVLYRDESGFPQTVRASDIEGIKEFVAEGAAMGHLWLEGRLGLGDPLVNAGAPKKKGARR